jgi:hypothetical protein
MNTALLHRRIRYFTYMAPSLPLVTCDIKIGRSFFFTTNSTAIGTLHIHSNKAIFGGVWFKNLEEWNDFVLFYILRIEWLRFTFGNKNEATPIFC